MKTVWHGFPGQLPFRCPGVLWKTAREGKKKPQVLNYSGLLPVALCEREQSQLAAIYTDLEGRVSQSDTAVPFGTDEEAWAKKEKKRPMFKDVQRNVPLRDLSGISGEPQAGAT